VAPRPLDIADVEAGLGEGHAAGSVYGRRPRIVGGKRQLEIAPVVSQELPEVEGPSTFDDGLSASMCSESAVTGINCITPIAPDGDSAPTLNLDSTRATPASSPSGSFVARAAATKSSCRPLGSAHR
jgi:hypothetical protein